MLTITTLHLSSVQFSFILNKKNSSGDEIVNVNFYAQYAVRTGSYPNSLKYGKITAITPFKVIQGHRFWYQ